MTHRLFYFRLFYFPGIFTFFFFGCTKHDDPNRITSSVFLSNQHEVDSFVNVYSGRSNINMDAVFSIGSEYPNDISDISGMRFLIRVEEFHIENTRLTSLSGLEGITSINNVFIFNNSLLLSLDGLKNLKSAEGFIEIYNNDALTSLGGLMSLEKVGWGIVLVNKFYDNPGQTNDKLATLSLPSLKELGQDLDFRDISAATSINIPLLDSVGGNILIRGASHLADLSGLNNLKHVHGDLSIGTSGITSLSGLNNLTSVGGIVTIASNPNLVNLTGLNSLKDIGDSLMVTNNTKLNNISALGATRTALKVAINSNPLLSNLCPIKPLVQNMLVLHPASPPALIFDFKNNSASLPQPYTYTNLLTGCP
jgi:hypothetical protein